MKKLCFKYIKIVINVILNFKFYLIIDNKYMNYNKKCPIIHII